ncbi:PIN domain-containing protein [Kitasatospora sp. NPDC056651]|uniref:PIN domain-containing protein n=1 Tax=Kitasatospora sp. NPDC056651 TaxID=3345892 RepID=UPI0036CE30CC
MQLSLPPGTNRDDALHILGEVSHDIGDLYTESDHYDADELLYEYLKWASSAVRRLEHVVSPADLDRLVLTRRYDQLLTNRSKLSSSSGKLVDGLLRLELSQRSRAFAEAVRELQAAVVNLGRVAANVVFDTSVFIHHPKKLEELSFFPLTGKVFGPFRLIVPMVVIDELDRLKESGKTQTRWRARYSLAVLDRIFADNRRGKSSATLSSPSPASSASGPRLGDEVIVEIVSDSAHHIRLPNPDDEIVDRALAMEPLVGAHVTLITYDTGQASRARSAGLSFRKLDMPLGPEPGPEPGKEVKRSNRTS